jgi:hypothetical protein
MSGPPRPRCWGQLRRLDFHADELALIDQDLARVARVATTLAGS